MKLYCNDELIGVLHNYSYDTPWARAELEPVDAAAYGVLCQASHFLNEVLDEDWGDLSPEEEAEIFRERLTKLGLTGAAVKRFQASRWEIREASHPDRQGPISLYACEPEGWLRWQWS